MTSVAHFVITPLLECYKQMQTRPRPILTVELPLGGRELPARQLQSILEKLKRKDGLLRDLDIIRHARNPRSPLHRYFEWHERSCVREYRRLQAQALVEGSGLPGLREIEIPRRRRARHR